MCRYRLRVRSAPNTTSGVIAELTEQQYAPIIGVNPNYTWWEVTGSFGTGWVSAAFVVANLIDPKFVLNGTDVNGAAAKYDIQPRSVSVGSAYELGKAVAAFDLPARIGTLFTGMA